MSQSALAYTDFTDVFLVSDDTYGDEEENEEDEEDEKDEEDEEHEEGEKGEGGEDNEIVKEVIACDVSPVAMFDSRIQILH